MSAANVELVRAIHPAPEVDLVRFFGSDGETESLAALEPLLDEGFVASGHGGGGGTVGPLHGVDGQRGLGATPGSGSEAPGCTG